MEALKYVHAVCAKIRVVLDKGYHLLHLLGSNVSLFNSLEKIGDLLSGAESVIDPRATPLPFGQENYVPSSIFPPNHGEEDEVESLMVASLGLVAQAAHDALDNILTANKMFNYLWVNAYGTEPYSDARRDVLAILLSDSQILLKFSNLEEELENFERSEISVLEVPHVPYMSSLSGSIDPIDSMIPE